MHSQHCLGPSAPCATSSTLPWPLGPMRGQHTLPRPLGPMRSKQHAASAPRPHVQQAARCLGPLAPCAVSTLPRPLGPMCSKQHAALAPRSHAQLALPRPLGPMRSKQHAALAPRPHARPTRYLGPSAPCAACPPALCPSASCRPRPHQRGLPACVVPLGLVSPEATPTRPARLHRAPRPHVARGHTCAATAFSPHHLRSAISAIFTVNQLRSTIIVP
ncbi:hypothetical protein C4D60_Mb09t19260 [Musa balbisiana]|uniref:Uncharacterized protein n=1 Tax=Musa balbisiana TaxID=52838 RepID=A0A4S8IHM0_MUSBA|nr:hypothetical protein C4D60_Mb09t19260 [Musa balbisiana]